MDRTGKIFAYCERGLDPSFWAEPFNAITNFGFIIAGALMLRELAARPGDEPKAFRYALIALVFLIGIGSFLFHTYATSWAALADVAPIGVFMLAYLGFALYRFVGVPLPVVFPLVAAFAYTIHQAMQLQCWRGQIGFSLPVPSPESAACLNGSAGYLPALAAMLLIGGWLTLRRHPAAPYVLGASVVFMLSVTFRTMDRIWCQDVVFVSRTVGTHFLWHILNSVTLFLLLLAAVRHGALASPARRRLEEAA
jgi:hypothetical protein